MARSSSSPRATVRTVYAAHFCQTMCRYEKPRGHLALAWFKRHSARVARRRLAADLRRESA